MKHLQTFHGLLYLNKERNVISWKARKAKSRQPKKESRTEETKAEESPDLSKIINEVKTEYERKSERQKAEYEKRIEERDKIIKELLADEHPKEKHNGIIDAINERREKQLKKW